ncbi:Stp1/IreP family PP2C-type Ser/Thr phosphatase [Phormidium sp. CCY1219]|jgi:protein phosphatase|uniref:Stp1/IreP family PP2C-type Ser/Thr phosphatase n=1 Tax=Phormidium sp. CCY1219 TaxID=2886104 RepID=UPI002D1E83B4|nr:Stp1/IreP family PP2C-type Ser/Thr phosphatase [Phormidium sp. CCY1219]MEB3831120.1 Stp1/IreP family PP2C-type Ser/Thr phosphatase [Phormidium sp. CCY1219]
MKRSFAGLTDTGLVRSVNQDAFYIDDPDGRFFIVADGMGGHAGGQEASRIATKTIEQYLDEHWASSETTPALLEEAFFKANQAIVQDQIEHPERADMGTTAVAVVFREDKPWCAHVGDSRLYLLRGDRLEQITEDHTWVGRALKAGHLSLEDARNHPWRHVLSQCLGREDLQQVDVQQIDVQGGDRFLLCSDGLTEELSAEEIASRLTSQLSGEEAARELVKAAKNNGGRDNITVAIVTLEDTAK